MIFVRRYAKRSFERVLSHANPPGISSKSSLIAPEVAAAAGSAGSAGVRAVSVAFTVTAGRIEITPLAAVFSTCGVGVIAIYFAGTGVTFRCNDDGAYGIGIPAGYRSYRDNVFGW